MLYSHFCHKLPTGTALRVPAEGLKGRLEKVPQACKEDGWQEVCQSPKYRSPTCLLSVTR